MWRKKCFVGILYYTVLYPTLLYSTPLYYTILYYTILYYTILYYTMLYYSWGKRSCHACWKLMLESKIKQFYHPRSEDSLQSTHMINQGGFFGFLVAGFAFISRDCYFGAPSIDCFWNIKKIFLTTIITWQQEMPSRQQNIYIE